MSARRSVFLCGFSGAGKSETGRILARLLGWEFIDTDDAIENKLGISIAEAFKKIGETEFRRIEREVVQTAARTGGKVVALGGGAVAEAGTLAHIKPIGLIVYLRVSAETAFVRLQNSHRRPKLNGASGDTATLAADLRTAIMSLMIEREPYYQQADICIDTEGKSPAEVAREIEQAVIHDKQQSVNHG
jgi:shikimate kinase